MAVGMGQMETKVFPAMFPDDFEASVETLLRVETLLSVEALCYIPYQQFPSLERNYSGGPTLSCLEGSCYPLTGYLV